MWGGGACWRGIWKDRFFCVWLLFMFMYSYLLLPDYSLSLVCALHCNPKRESYCRRGIRWRNVHSRCEFLQAPSSNAKGCESLQVLVFFVTGSLSCRRLWRWPRIPYHKALLWCEECGSDLVWGGSRSTTTVIFWRWYAGEKVAPILLLYKLPIFCVIV